jgi:hypothetical protein
MPDTIHSNAPNTAVRDTMMTNDERRRATTTNVERRTTTMCCCDAVYARVIDRKKDKANTFTHSLFVLTKLLWCNDQENTE